VTRLDSTFAALIGVQAVHSIEEYLGRLYVVFPPARLVSGLVTRDPQFGFIILNVALVLFGIWCLLWPIRRRWKSAGRFVWLWIVVEVVNGVVHPMWSLIQWHYTPGVATAPILLALALFLAHQMRTAHLRAAV
jgi:hypothetical protein